MAVLNWFDSWLPYAFAALSLLSMVVGYHSPYIMVLSCISFLGWASYIELRRRYYKRP